MSNNRLFLTALCALLMSAYAQAAEHLIVNLAPKDVWITMGYSENYCGSCSANVEVRGTDNFGLSAAPDVWHTRRQTLSVEKHSILKDVHVKIFDDRGNCIDPYTGKKMFYLKIIPPDGELSWEYYIESSPAASHGWPYQVVEKLSPQLSVGGTGAIHVPWSNKSCPLGMVAK